MLIFKVNIMLDALSTPNHAVAVDADRKKQDWLSAVIIINLQVVILQSEGLLVQILLSLGLWGIIICSLMGSRGASRRGKCSEEGPRNRIQVIDAFKPQSPFTPSWVPSERTDYQGFEYANLVSINSQFYAPVTIRLHEFFFTNLGP